LSFVKDSLNSINYHPSMSDSFFLLAYATNLCSIASLFWQKNEITF